MSPAPDFREINIRVRFHLDERQMLRDLQAATGLTAADWIRQAVRKAYEELPEDAKTKMKRKR